MHAKKEHHRVFTLYDALAVTYTGSSDDTLRAHRCAVPHSGDDDTFLRGAGMYDLLIADIDRYMAYAGAVAVEDQIARLQITDRYGCTYSSLDTCTSRDRITEVQVYLLGEA